jgi:hypothetical protein
LVTWKILIFPYSGTHATTRIHAHQRPT